MKNASKNERLSNSLQIMYEHALGDGDWWLQTHNAGLLVAALCYLTSVWFSWAEIEIEGAFTWQMSNTHTWRWQWSICGPCGVCGNGLALTGYHLTQFTTVFLFMFATWISMCFFYGHPVLWSTAFLLASMYVLIVTLEDNGWYTYNMEFAWAQRVYGTKNPFGGHNQRVTRYVVCIVISLAFWYASFSMQAHEAAEGLIASPTKHQSDQWYMVVYATVAFLFIGFYAYLFTILEKRILLPLYKTFRTQLVKHSVRVEEVAQNATLTGILSNNIVAKDAYVPPAGYAIDLRPPSVRRAEHDEHLHLMSKKAATAFHPSLSRLVTA